MEQGTLFDADVPAPVPVAVPVRPASGVSGGGVWRRTALRRDCRGCWERQDREFRSGALLGRTRRAASLELVDTGSAVVVSVGFYCVEHAGLLGWDSTNPRSRQPVDLAQWAGRCEALALRELVELVARGRVSDVWQNAVVKALRAAGAGGVEMPSWTVASGGGLLGLVHDRPRRVLTEWAEHFGTDVETERLPGEVRLFVRVLVAGVPVLLVGHTDQTGMGL